MIGQRLYVALVDYWWMPVLGAILAGGIGLAVALVSPPTFEAIGTFVLTPQPAPATDEGLDIVAEGLDALSSNDGTLVNTYADMVASPRVVSDAATQIGMGSDERDRYDVAGVRTPDSNVVQLSVTGPNAARATELGGAVAAVSTDLFADLYRVVDIETIRTPRAQQTPVSTSPEQSATVAAVLGIVAGVALALLRDTLTTETGAWTPEAVDGPPREAERTDDHDRSAAMR